MTEQQIETNNPKSKETPWRKLRWYVMALVLIGILFSLMKLFNVELNLTSSMPVGFYRKINTSIHVGSLAEVCLPRKIASEGLAKGYLVKGDCPGGAIAVLKEVIAIPGQTINVSNKGMRVGWLSYPAPVEAVDHQNRPVKRFIKNGTFKNTKLYWLYGAGDFVHSWDSRYYGGVSANHIKGVYKPVLTF